MTRNEIIFYISKEHKFKGYKDSAKMPKEAQEQYKELKEYYERLHNNIATCD